MGGKNKSSKRSTNEIVRKETTSKESIHTPKGLQNLGNTCYFNSALQCLSRVSSLQEGLLQRIDKDICVFIGKYNDNGSLTKLKLNVSSLNAPLSMSYIKFSKDSNEMSKSNNNCVSPVLLRDSLVRKYPRFEGFDQHDSHEVLRCLLDGLRQEDLKGWQLAILSNLSVNAKTASDAQKAEVRTWNRALGLCTVVDRIFGGITLTSLTCMKCSSVLQNFETFLDLSLPIVEESNQLVSKKSYDIRGKHLKSKRQTSRERKPRRKPEKAKRKNKYSKFKRGASACLSDSDEKEADISDFEKSNTHENEVASEDALVRGDSPVSGICTHESQLKSPLELDTTGIISCIDEDFNTAAEDDASAFDMPVEQCVVDLQNSNDSSEPVLNLIQNLRHLHISECENSTSNFSEEVQAQKIAQEPLSSNPTRAKNSVRTDLERYLMRYTEPEILRGGNQLICDTCTRKNHQSSTSPSPKKEATRSDCVKRDLILKPPAVLTIHLKRFEQIGYRLQKCSKKVTFPLHLELNPFCSKLSWNIPEGEIMYRLFAIVEHTGSLRGGHYVSYVAIDSPKYASEAQSISIPKSEFYSKSDYPECLPLNTSQLVDRLRHCNRNFLLDVKNNSGTAPCSHDDGFYSNSDSSPPLNSSNDCLADKDESGSINCGFDGADDRIWFLCSDSHVSPVSLSVVLNCQPYILFYERTL